MLNEQNPVEECQPLDLTGGVRRTKNILSQPKKNTAQPDVRSYYSAGSERAQDGEAKKSEKNFCASFLFVSSAQKR